MKVNRSLHYIFGVGILCWAFITPLLITLSLSGIGYLFREEVEDFIYKDLYFGKSAQTESISMSDSISLTEKKYPHYSVAKISEFNGDYNTRLTIANEYTGQQKYVYLDSNNQIVGDQNASETFANIMRELHSSLLVGGTIVNYTVELAACWTIFLIITGLYMSIRQFKTHHHPIREKKQKTSFYYRYYIYNSSLSASRIWLAMVRIYGEPNL